MSRAFDELRFDRARTLDLRASLPTARQATERAEAWLRERQATVGGEVLIVTGRGRGSDGGVPVVRPAIEQRLARLRRQGVVAEVRSHNAGSFVVTLAPLRELLTATRRKKDPPVPAPPAVLGDIDPEIRSGLRALAIRSLEVLGAPRSPEMIHDEMLRQFSRLAGSLRAAANREQHLRKAIRLALEEMSE